MNGKKLTIRFKRQHHQFKAGDEVSHLDEGTCRTMIDYHIAELVSEEEIPEPEAIAAETSADSISDAELDALTAPVKSIDAPPDNKAIGVGEHPVVLTK